MSEWLGILEGYDPISQLNPLVQALGGLLGRESQNKALDQLLSPQQQSGMRSLIGTPDVGGESASPQSPKALSLGPNRLALKDLENRYERALALNPNAPQTKALGRQVASQEKETKRLEALAKENSKFDPIPEGHRDAVREFAADRENLKLSDAEYLARAIDAGLPYNVATELTKDRAQSNREARTGTAKFREEMSSRYREGGEMRQVLHRMKELEEKGNLTTPGVKKIIDTFGIPLGVLNNPHSEEYDKLSQEIIQRYTNLTGGRLLAAQMNNFLRRIPTLLNSDEGKSLIRKNIAILQDLQDLDFVVMREIVAENGGNVPYDLSEQVAERSRPLKEQLSEEFNASMSNEGASAVKGGSEEVLKETVEIIKPNGRRTRIPSSQLEEALRLGGRRA